MTTHLHMHAQQGRSSRWQPARDALGQSYWQLLQQSFTAWPSSLHSAPEHTQRPASSSRGRASPWEALAASHRAHPAPPREQEPMATRQRSLREEHPLGARCCTEPWPRVWSSPAKGICPPTDRPLGGSSPCGGPQRSARPRLPGYGRNTPIGSRSARPWSPAALPRLGRAPWLTLPVGSQVIVEKAERSDIPDIDKKK